MSLVVKGGISRQDGLTLMERRKKVRASEPQPQLPVGEIEVVFKGGQIAHFHYSDLPLLDSLVTYAFLEVVDGVFHASITQKQLDNVVSVSRKRTGGLTFVDVRAAIDEVRLAEERPSRPPYSSSSAFSSGFPSSTGYKDQPVDTLSARRFAPEQDYYGTLFAPPQVDTLTTNLPSSRPQPSAPPDDGKEFYPGRGVSEEPQLRQRVGRGSAFRSASSFGGGSAFGSPSGRGSAFGSTPPFGGGSAFGGTPGRSAFQYQDSTQPG